MLWVKFSVVDRIRSKHNKFASSVELNTATGDSKLQTLAFMSGQICKIEECWAKLSVISSVFLEVNVDLYIGELSNLNALKYHQSNGGFHAAPQTDIRCFKHIQLLVFT